MENEIIIKISKLEEYKKKIELIDGEKLNYDKSDNIKIFNQIIDGRDLNSKIISRVLDKAYINGNNIEFKLKMNIDEIL